IPVQNFAATSGPEARLPISGSLTSAARSSDLPAPPVQASYASTSSSRSLAAEEAEAGSARTVSASRVVKPEGFTLIGADDDARPTSADQPASAALTSRSDADNKHTENSDGLIEIDAGDNDLHARRR